MGIPRGYAPRPPGAPDLAAIEQLLAACDAAEPVPSYAALAHEFRGVTEDTGRRGGDGALVVASGDGRVVGCAAVTLPDYPRPVARARLSGAVHPQHRRRGLGGFLLDWSEDAARRLFDEQREERPRSLRITFAGERSDARWLYAHRGFGVFDVALQLRRDLGGPLGVGEPNGGRGARGSRRPPALPAGISCSAWSADTRDLFYAVHAACHAGGPEVVLATPKVWVRDVEDDASLRRDLSFVAVDGDRPCAYLLSEVVTREGRRVGWVWLLGVDRRYRRRGLATALLLHVLDAFRREGLPEVGLWVSEENGAARAVYERLGFRERSRLTTYAKAT